MIEIRDLEEARRYVLQSFWLARVISPQPNSLATTLDWLNAILSEGNPSPPIGLIADLGQIVFGQETTLAREPLVIPGWPNQLADSYQHHVLGKFFADPAFERATHALARYEGKDRQRGLAFLIKQFLERAQYNGVTFSNAVVRSLRQANLNVALAEGFDSFTQLGLHPFLKPHYESLISATRRLHDVLGPEDVIALEQRTALDDMSRFVAHRQILTQTARFEDQLPLTPLRPPISRREVPTRILDEDQYPVGGYTSIANRGSIESLLHSQLAYMENHESPDLFDVKFVRDELFFYSRDENQFLRRRRTFVFVFSPDLVATRFKDSDLPSQRIVMISAAVLAIIRKLMTWLSADALRFELHFVMSGESQPLGNEAELLKVLLRDPIANGSVIVSHTPNLEDVMIHAERLSRSSQVQVLEVAVKPNMAEPEGTIRTTLVVHGSRPELIDGYGRVVPIDSETALDAWQDTVRSLLEFWV